ncbi:MAG TPA: hypothetical protein VNP95_02740 [Thermomicrobiales bacterium]|nr:hypothetical protein [Thermomicrobiales bacterium]
MPMPHAHSLTRRALLGGIAATTATATATALLVPAFAGTATAAGPATTRSLLREKPAPSLEILTDILQRLPGNLVTLDDPPIPFTFADVQAQYTALGIPAFTEWDGTPEQFRMYGNATSMLPLGQVGAFLYTADEEFLAAIGFNPLATHQALQVGLASGAVMAFRGGFDPEGVTAALEASGYAPMTTITGQPAWSNGPDGEFSPMDPIQRRTVGAMNNAFVLDDEWLIFTRTLATLDAIAAFAAATTEDSVFAAPGVSETIAMLNDETVSVLALQGDMLTPEMTFPPEDAALPEALAASDATTGPLPAASLLAMAVTAGIRPLADGEDAAALEEIVVQALLAMTSPTDAEAAAEIVAARWDALSSTVTSGPYTDLLTIDTAEAVGTVAAFDFTVAGPPSAWFRLIDNRDWLPFVTTGA